MDNKKIKLIKSYNALKFINRFSGNLVIFCSDERFVDSATEFIKKKLKRADFFVLPGSIAFWCLNEKENIEKLKLLIEKHNVKKIYIFAHQDCGFYKFIYPNSTQQEIFYFQISDLLKFKNKLKKEYKSIQIKAFYMEAKDNKIIFSEIK